MHETPEARRAGQRSRDATRLLGILDTDAATLRGWADETWQLAGRSAGNRRRVNDRVKEIVIGTLDKRATESDDPFDGLV